MSAVKKADLKARVAALEAELARVKALAEGAQRAAFRIHERLVDLASNLSNAANLDRDRYDVCDAFSTSLYQEEDERAARIIRGEPAEGDRFHKQRA